MSTTYLQAVNEVLADSNEVELTSGNFATAVGVQKIAKNAVNRAYMELCAKNIEWPFLKAANSNTNDPYDGNVTQETTSGLRWYLLKAGATTIADDYAKVDWESFYITTDGATGRSAPYEHENLIFTDYQEWVGSYRESEQSDAADQQTYGAPKRVIRSKDGRYFGLSPIPSGAYTVYFTAWVRPTKLSLHGDILLVPDEYMPVVYTRASYYLNKFKGDANAMAADNAAFEKLLREMQRALIPMQSQYMRDDRIRF